VLLDLNPTTVDEELDACAIARIIGSEEDGCLRDLVRLSKAT